MINFVVRHNKGSECKLQWCLKVMNAYQVLLLAFPLPHQYPHLPKTVKSVLTQLSWLLSPWNESQASKTAEISCLLQFPDGSALLPCTSMKMESTCCPDPASLMLSLDGDGAEINMRDLMIFQDANCILSFIFQSQWSALINRKL